MTDPAEDLPQPRAPDGALVFTFICAQCGYTEHSPDVLSSCPSCLGGMRIARDN